MNEIGVISVSLEMYIKFQPEALLTVGSINPSGVILLHHDSLPILCISTFFIFLF